MSVVNKAYFSGGCFWCTEAIYKRLKGVLDVKPGYCGGNIQNPTYKEVCSGKTGHAETVEISYDTTIIDFQSLLKVFFDTHDPTTLNRQGNDVGTQYRSAIFYKNEKELNVSESMIKKLDDSNLFDYKIVTSLEKETKFFEAEEYHKKYFYNNPENVYCQLVVKPKIEKFKKSRSSFLKN